MSGRRPQVLEELGSAVQRPGAAAAGALARGPASTVLLALALVLALAGATAAAIVIARGGSLPAANPRDLAANGVPLPGSERLAGLEAPDPDSGEPSWDLRLSRTAAGETCTAVGQVLGGQFGIVGLDHVFRALPLGGVDACGVPSQGAPVLAGVRVFLGRTPSQVRTVVDGVAGAGARSVTVYGPGGARRLRLGPDGSFITVYAGYVEEVRPRLLIVDGSGRRAPARVRPDDGPGSARPRRPLAVGGQRRPRPRSGGLSGRELHAGIRGARSQRPQSRRSPAHARGLRAAGWATAVRADAPVRAGQRRTHGLSVGQHAGADARLRGGRSRGSPR